LPDTTLVLAQALRGSGLLAYAEGRHDDARRFFEEALALFRQQEDATGIGFALIGLGELARTEGRYEEASNYYTEQLALRRAQGSDLNAAVCLHNLGHVALARGQPDQALALLTESLGLYHRFGAQQGMAEALAGLAAVQAAAGHLARAVRWFATAENWLRTLGAALDPSDQMVFDRHLALARQHLPAADFAAAWAEGVLQAESSGLPAVREALQAAGLAA
jgi:tetratricopeptide (TPR) repeat protein